MAKALYFICALAVFVAILGVEGVTEAISSEDHIKDLVNGIGGECGATTCHTKIQDLRKLDSKSLICLSFIVVKDCFDGCISAEKSQYMSKIDDAQEICDGCSTIKISGMILLLALLLNYIF
ncbi:uncharacterized protein LOC131956220 [Physella acuta]|uniref:uncharacterized protein LOC131956220 n=1 Tax=Physella acuta TaxID=109671 RepID=UPI0027DE7C1C|nr:uncharacterized protein LOC131956220 [Physella acuta]